MKDVEKQERKQLNCYEKLELLNDKLKQLARVMNDVNHMILQQQSQGR